MASQLHERWSENGFRIRPTHSVGKRFSLQVYCVILELCNRLRINHYTKFTLSSCRLLIYVYMPGKSSVEVWFEGDWSSSPKMTYGRYDFATCVEGDRIIVAGGVSNTSGDAYVRQTEIFSTVTKNWTIVGRTITFCRKLLALVQAHGSLYAVGGDADGSVIRNDAIADEHWSCSVTNVPNVPSYDALFLNGEIYYAGKSEDLVSIFGKFRLANNQWYVLQNPFYPWIGRVRLAIVPNWRRENAEHRRLETWMDRYYQGYVLTIIPSADFLSLVTWRCGGIYTVQAISNPRVTGIRIDINSRKILVWCCNISNTIKYIINKCGTMSSSRLQHPVILWNEGLEGGNDTLQL